MRKIVIVFFNVILLLLCCSCQKTGNMLEVTSDITNKKFQIEYPHIINYCMPTQCSFLLNEPPEQFFEKLKDIDGYLYEYTTLRNLIKAVYFFKEDSYYSIEYSRIVKGKYFYSLEPEEYFITLNGEDQADTYKVYLPKHIITSFAVLGEKMEASESWNYVKEYYQRISTALISQENKTIELNAVKGDGISIALEYLPVIISYDESDSTIKINLKA